MDITPATIDQLFIGKNGRFVEVDGEVARKLAEVDAGLKLRYSELGDYFVVYHEQEKPDGGTYQQLVFTAQDCDMRIPARAWFIQSRGYNFADEVERLQEEKDKALQREWEEMTGPLMEKLYWAFKKDLGIKDKAFISKGLK